MRPDGPKPPGGNGTEPVLLIHCPSCAQTVRREDSTACAICARRVCLACIRPYGHHMRACEDCRLAEW
ncbi:hypothetical protein [Anaeromyxobacter oryzae]|uniref:RING-type domain-containing protein n=1 Tax=Anaeromyxobacter oryzae TaxID=2918170 RepID=A0ABM7WNN9_9BACT|nr:hypothetical protein [Anaeromyxobacter oryzae]BDG01070.1 hypothetical protein AMOR_00660 [Anaeromyxobacter oryzae]